MKDQCTVARAPCVHCKQLYRKAKLKAHEDECTEAVEACPAASIGCRVQCKRSELDKHANECPLAALQPTVRLMSNRIKEQDTALSALRNRNDCYEANFNSMREVLEGSFPIPVSAHAKGGNHLPNLQATLAQPSSRDDEMPQIDNATHHLLSMQESLREELDRLGHSVTELDARTSMTIINENLRLKEDMSRMNGAIGALRMQMQWLISARMNFQTRSPVSVSTSIGNTSDGEGTQGPGAGIRRSSDSSRQDTKL